MTELNGHWQYGWKGHHYHATENLEEAEEMVGYIKGYKAVVVRRWIPEPGPWAEYKP